MLAKLLKFGRVPWCFMMFPWISDINPVAKWRLILSQHLVARLSVNEIQQYGTPRPSSSVWGSVWITCFGGFHKWVPQNGWFVRKNPINYWRKKLRPKCRSAIRLSTSNLCCWVKSLEPWPVFSTMSIFKCSFHSVPPSESQKMKGAGSS